MAAVPLTVLLAIVASGGRARGGVIIYAVGLCSMLAVSVTYHRWVHTVRARAAWRRADHATIYAAIGGTFTPLCLLAFGTVWHVVILVVVWVAVIVGAIIKAVDWRHAHHVGVVLYLGIGWAGVLLFPAVWSRSGLLAGPPAGCRWSPVHGGRDRVRPEMADARSERFLVPRGVARLHHRRRRRPPRRDLIVAT